MSSLTTSVFTLGIVVEPILQSTITSPRAGLVPPMPLTETVDGLIVTPFGSDAIGSIEKSEAESTRAIDDKVDWVKCSSTGVNGTEELIDSWSGVVVYETT